MVMTDLALLGLLLLGFLLAEVAHRYRRRLAPRTSAPPLTSIVEPAESWTALDDQELARFARDASS
jgi:hypothetical protein